MTILSFPAPFDNALAVNAHMFWREPSAALAGLARCSGSGGTLALTFQPRQPGATDQDAVRAGEQMAAEMRTAGFEAVRVELLAMKPVAAVCVLGRTVSEPASMQAGR